MHDLPESLQMLHIEAQRKADECGEPVRVHIRLTVDGHHVADQFMWVYPIAAFDLWEIVDGKPVYRTPVTED